MRINTTPPIRFTSAPPDTRTFTDLLQGAKPYANYRGDFNSNSIVLDEQNQLTVSPAIGPLAGGGSVHYQFMDDGSVQKIKYGPAVFPPVAPTITQALPAGSIPPNLLTQIKAKVQKALANLT